MSKCLWVFKVTFQSRLWNFFSLCLVWDRRSSAPGSRITSEKRAVFGPPGSRDEGHVLVTERRGMALKGLFCADVLRPLDLPPPHRLHLQVPPWPPVAPIGGKLHHLIGLVVSTGPAVGLELYRCRYYRSLCQRISYTGNRWEQRGTDFSVAYV